MARLGIFRNLEDWREFRDYLDESSGGEPLTLGFVPTMGALHAGHGELIKRAASENDACVVSIYVNPTQFNDPQDLEKYPRQLEKDLELAASYGARYVIAPSPQELYPDAYRFRVNESPQSEILCGAHRPGHFTGMLTVVLKLLNVVRPKRAYFGEKDFQQLTLVRDMVDALFLEIQIVGVPTIREEDGLALSSRNQRLTPEERLLAPKLAQLLRTPAPLDAIRDELVRLGFRVDYLEEHWGRRLVAAHLGSVRLIDNVVIPVVATAESSETQRSLQP